MKKTIIITLVLLASFTSYSQSTPNKPKQDTIRLKATPDTPLLTIKDYNEFVETLLQELEIKGKYADIIRNWWIQKLNARIAEYEKPRIK